MGDGTAGGASRGGGRLRVLVYPKHDNPYQDLLYGAMRKQVTVRYLARRRFAGLLVLPPMLILRRLQGFKILHIHWQAFEIRRPIPYQRLASSWSYRFFFGLIRMLGFRVVWTVHNVLPHESQTPDDAEVGRQLSMLARAQIVHSAQTVRQMRELGMDTGRSVVIPHGSYIDAYPPAAGRALARMALSLPADVPIVLFFGRVRAYKGVLCLLDEIAALPKGSVHLVIAGQAGDRVLVERINAAVASLSVTFVNRRIDDSEVGDFFAAADLVCAPFASITTSGSVMLALSMGKPVVAPRRGALVDLPNEVGYFYNPEDAAGLRKALEDALGAGDRNQRGQAGRAHVEPLGWSEIAARTVTVYKNIGHRSGEMRP